MVHGVHSRIILPLVGLSSNQGENAPERTRNFLNLTEEQNLAPPVSGFAYEFASKKTLSHLERTAAVSHCEA